MAVIDLTVATTDESLRGSGQELPSWARAHLAYHAARGGCAHDPRDLEALYARIARYRSEAGVDDDERSRSIEETIFGTAPDNSVLRMKRRALVDEALPRDLVARPAPARFGA